MAYVKALDTSELAEGKMAMVAVGGTEVLLANVGGTYYAIANRCNHMGGSLVKGTLEGSIVTCPRHGSQYDVTTGQCVRGARLALVTWKVKDEVTYAVKVEGTAILVEVP